jgi:hypothetical protein
MTGGTWRVWGDRWHLLHVGHGSLLVVIIANCLHRYKGALFTVRTFREEGNLRVLGSLVSHWSYGMECSWINGSVVAHGTE